MGMEVYKNPKRIPLFLTRRQGKGNHLRFFFFFSPKLAPRPSLPIKLHCHGGTNTKTERKPFFLSEDLGKRPVEIDACWRNFTGKRANVKGDSQRSHLTHELHMHGRTQRNTEKTEN